MAPPAAAAVPAGETAGGTRPAGAAAGLPAGFPAAATGAPAAGPGALLPAGYDRRFFEAVLGRYRDLALEALLAQLPDGGPRHLWELVPDYPRRGGKGLRAAFCLAAAGALGGSTRRALNTAVAIELLHNGFLLHDDVQDASELRRGAPTLLASHGAGVAVNVGNATNLLALARLMANRELLGPALAWRILEESERMMRRTLEGQALELGWIRDNACDLAEADYYRMCLKKTSWYTAIHPCRMGALIARGERGRPERFDRFGWYLGAAFQIQDDLLNLEGEVGLYGKEIGGDLYEGKRTLMLIHLLRRAAPDERRRLVGFLARPRAERSPGEVRWVHRRMLAHGSIDAARRAARRLAGAALREGLAALAGVPDSDDKRFLLEAPLYVVERDR